jgi:pimeloyl-ACP methyl ester carboxylesterase
MRLGMPALVGGVVAATAAGVVRQRRHNHHQDGDSVVLGTVAPSRQRRVETTDGITLHVEEVGPLDAELTVLFVHGFTLNLQAFDLQRVALSEHFGDRIRMVFFDLRSHGRSDKSAFNHCGFDQLGADINSVLEAVVPAGDAAIIAHSMGGMAVMALAAQQPELFGADAQHRCRINAVALLNSSPGNLKVLNFGLPAPIARLGSPAVPFVLRRAAKSVELVERARFIASDLSRYLTKRLSFASDSVPPEIVSFASDMIAATPVDVVAAFFPALTCHDGAAGLRALAGCRLLVIGAEQDAMLPAAHSVAIAAAVPGARLVMVADAGHLLMLEHPQAVNAPLLELLDAALVAASR